MDSSREEARFSCMNEADPGAAMVMKHNRDMVEYLTTMPVVPEEDLRAYCARQRALLGLSTQVI